MITTQGTFMSSYKDVCYIWQAHPILVSLTLVVSTCKCLEASNPDISTTTTFPTCGLCLELHSHQLILYSMYVLLFLVC